MVWVVLSSYQADVVADDGRLGRLFTSPAERTELDQARSKFIPGQEFEATNKEVEQASHTHLNGYVIRNNGKSTVWVNNKIYTQENPESDGITVNTHRLQRKRAKLNINGRSLVLKPGQVVNNSNGQVLEAYKLENKLVQVDPKKSALDKQSTK